MAAMENTAILRGFPCLYLIIIHEIAKYVNRRKKSFSRFHKSIFCIFHKFILIPDGIYGRQTALAVRAFQQKNGLRPNGETNRATWDAIVNAYRQQIQREATPLHLYTPERELLGAGETGLLVLVLQSILKTLGVRYTNIQNLQITGIYDAPTQKAVQNFQSLTARKPTGMVDRATWNLLVAAAECSSL